MSKKSVKYRYMYVIQDRLAEAYGPVYDCANDGIALRQFRVALEKSPYVSDFSLICIGFFDPDTLKIYDSGCPRVVEFDLHEFKSTQEVVK